MTSKIGRPAPKKKPKIRLNDDQDIEDVPSFTKGELAQFRFALLDWYDKEHRILPWRRNPHSLHQSRDDSDNKRLLKLPVQEFMYRVWISEVMLQQTQVSRVTTYFKKWIERWPTVQALAAADMEQVNSLWAGLGYYRRGRYLLEGAQYVQQKLGGQLPVTKAALQSIPGIGAYTSSAMASIAAGEKVAAVDANVIRVVSRLRCLSNDPKSKSSAQLHANLAALLLDPERPGDFNQAMMELGACICTGTTPACETCPVRSHCHAYARLQDYAAAGGDIAGPSAPLVTQYPSKSEKLIKKEHCRAVCVVKLLAPRTRARPAETLFLMVKRAEGGLLAGLWEFPGQEVPGDMGSGERAAVLDGYLQHSLRLKFPDGAQLQVKERRTVGVAVHEFSHIRCTMRLELLVLQGQVPVLTSDQTAVARPPPMRWVEEKALASEGLSGRERKVLSLLGL